MIPDPTELLDLASAYLVRQGWFPSSATGEGDDAFVLVAFAPLRDGEPGLARMLLARGDAHFQLLVGWRPSSAIAGVVRGEESAILGAVVDGETRLIVYDALADDELCKTILEIATDHRRHARRVRPVASLASHASLVFDEQVFMKCYRVLESKTRPEVEVMFGLSEVGFESMLTPIARWRDHEFDLGLVREFLPSALEGRLLALTSLRDLLGHAGGAAEGFAADGKAENLDEMASTAGGDLASEAARLGRTTAELHLALSVAFGTRPLVEGDFAAVADDQGLASAIAEGGLGSLGLAIRLHGDYHLRRVMRSETGWLIAGFGDDPLYATELRDPTLPARTGTPLEDLADMSFALGRVVADALEQRSHTELDRSLQLALAWRRRNRSAFLRGYFRTEGIDALIPADPDRLERVLVALEAFRERRYEATTSSE